MARRSALSVATAIALAACGATSEGRSDPERAPTVAAREFPPAPAAPTGPNDAATEAWDRLVDSIEDGSFDTAEVGELARTGDVRHAWLVADLLRFVSDEVIVDTAVQAFDTLTGAELASGGLTFRTAWNDTTDLLIAWDIPAPPDFRQLKGRLYTLVEPRWTPFFDDEASTIDWRWISWGGVFVDDRPLGSTDPCERGCIPALDDPALVPAEEGDWYPDDSIVFGVTEGDEAVALPKNVMEVHEMVNTTIGGRRFGIPYCTLCGSAQAFHTEGVTDRVPDGVDTPILRTSGLLNRSNKVMYDLVTSSVFDTFTGEAVSGPLREVGVVLDQTSVTVSTWGEWKAAHPHTTIVAEDGGIGREYDEDPLRGRDDDGPIFPIGDVDPRLPTQEPVLGVVLDDGATVAFPTAAVRRTLADGDEVTLGDVRVEPDAGGFVALVDGDEVATHQAFWFAWSQFHPDTLLWPDDR